jgi:deoxyribonuclease-4
MPLLGAHMSIAGGLPLAVDRAVAHRCEVLQIFSKSSGQWRARPLERTEVRDFRARVERAGLAAVVAHASYLINLGTSDPALRAQSIDAFGVELDRAEALGLLGVVVHPGCYTTGTEEDGLRLVAEAVRQVVRERRGRHAMVLLEHTAGQGTSLGWRFEQLGRILERLDGHPRVGVCLDTCHLFAAGYDLSTPAGYERTFDTFREVIGFDRLRAFHLNDSKRALGSRRDRHAHIGDGQLGIEAFRRLVNDRRFGHLPMLLETPKTEGRAARSIAVDPLDAMNLAVLRGLINAVRPRRTPPPGT